MPTIAVFDLDGTITRGDTFVAFALHALRRQPARLPHYLSLPVTAARLALGRIGDAEAKQHLLWAAAAGYSRDELTTLTQDFIRTTALGMVKPAARDRIARHAEKGDILVLATAGMDIYAEALGSTLGFPHVLATKAAWRGDRLVFGLTGHNLKGEAKLVAVRDLVARLGGGTIVAYSDHHSDLPLLRYATRGIAVDPTRRLQQAIAGSALRTERWNA